MFFLKNSVCDVRQILWCVANKACWTALACICESDSSGFLPNNKVEQKARDWFGALLSGSRKTVLPAELPNKPKKMDVLTYCSLVHQAAWAKMKMGRHFRGVCVKRQLAQAVLFQFFLRFGRESVNVPCPLHIMNAHSIGLGNPG